MKLITEISPAAVKILAAGEKDINYISDLRKGLNKLTNRGKDLHFAGKGHIEPANPVDQQVVDTVF